MAELCQTVNLLNLLWVVLLPSSWYLLIADEQIS